MTPRRVTIDGIHCWDRQSVLRAGYGETGITCTEAEVTFGRQQDVCRQLDAAAESIECLRVGLDKWEYFRNGKGVGPYVERPLLGF